MAQMHVDGSAAPFYRRSMTFEASERQVAMRLDLSPDQARLLDRILSAYLSDLRVEVRATDSYGFRQDLKREQTMVREIVERIEASPEFIRLSS